MASLTVLSESFGKTINKALLALYVETLADLSPEQCIMAFARCSEEVRFWPTSAHLRELGGKAPAGDPIEAEGKNSLEAILGALRVFPTLTPVQGGARLIEDDFGGSAIVLEPENTPPDIGDHARRAVTKLGYGDFQTGLKFLRDHPALQKEPEDSLQWRTNALKASDELERRYLRAWRETSK